MDYRQRMNAALVKAQRAVNNLDGTYDPISGYELGDIKAYILNCPVGCEAISKAAYNKVREMERVAIAKISVVGLCTRDMCVTILTTLQRNGLDELGKAYGMTVEDMLEESIMDSISPGICTNCGYTTNVEPDSDSGYCEQCGANAVISACMLVCL